MSEKSTFHPRIIVFEDHPPVADQSESFIESQVDMDVTPDDHLVLDSKTLKNTYSYAKNDHVKGPIRKFLAHRTNIIVMNLTRYLKESIHKMAEVAKLGKN